MSSCRCLLAGALVFACTLPAPASQLFSKKSKVNPAQRVPELISSVQQDQDERKRANAAEELRQFNTQEFPEIAAILIDVLKKDASASVRLEAAATLSRVRPATKSIRDALEAAANNDANWRVRLNARSSLMFYHVPSEATAKKGEQGPSLPPMTIEPPLFDPGAATRKSASSPAATPVSNPKRLQPVPVQAAPAATPTPAIAPLPQPAPPPLPTAPLVVPPPLPVSQPVTPPPLVTVPEPPSPTEGPLLLPPPPPR